MGPLGISSAGLGSCRFVLRARSGANRTIDGKRFSLGPSGIDGHVGPLKRMKASKTLQSIFSESTKRWSSSVGLGHLKYLFMSGIHYRTCRRPRVKKFLTRVYIAGGGWRTIPRPLRRKPYAFTGAASFVF
jgi:hypothetical protein